MTPDKQRIAIAEFCGWTVGDRTWQNAWIDQDGNPHEAPPNYLHDLNAMHAAEKMLSNDQCDTYETHLCKAADKVVTDWITGKSKSITIATTYCFHTTAAQRAEAFLRTIGKWEDK